MHTGTAQFIRPSFGAWTLYGLGTENDSLPGFVSLNPLPGGSRNFGSAFLPAVFGGTQVGRPSRAGGGGGRPQSNSNQSVPDIRNSSLTKQHQRMQLDLIQSLNREKIAVTPLGIESEDFSHRPNWQRNEDPVIG